MKFALGYNTNGLAHHTLEQILDLCVRYGYQGLALTLDTHHLNPFHSSDAEIHKIRTLLEAHSLRVVIETGGRYILHPERKHFPTLLHKDGAKIRLSFLERCLEIGSLLGAEALSFWSGVVPENVTRDQAIDRLSSGIDRLLLKARVAQIPLALEPEPGMLVENLSQVLPLLDRFNDPFFGLTLDLGHLECSETQPLDRHIITVGSRIKNVHIEDIKDQKHEHLPFGEGTMDFIPLFKALQRIRYQGLINVELSRNSHDGPMQMQRSIRFLTSVYQQCEAP